MKVELRRVLAQPDDGAVGVVNVLDWLPDMPIPGPHDVLMDAAGNWSTVLRRFFYEDPPKVALQLTPVDVIVDIDAWLEGHQGWVKQ